MYTAPSELKNVEEAFKNAGIELLQAESEMVPNNYIVPEENQVEKIENLIDAVEELDDVQNVYHNADI